MSIYKRIGTILENKVKRDASECAAQLKNYYNVSAKNLSVKFSHKVSYQIKQQGSSTSFHFVILDKQKKRAWIHTGNNRAVITLKTTFAETNYFHRCTSLSLYKICRAQSAVRTSVPCNYILKLAARGGRQFPLVFCQKEVYNANKNHYKKGDILWIAMYLKS